MGKSKVNGIKSRREVALKSLEKDKARRVKLKEDMPPRISKEISILENKIKNYSRKNR